MTSASSFSGLHKVEVSERRGAVERHVGLTTGAMQEALQEGGLDLQTADKLIENVVGTYALPFAVGVHMVLNGEARVVPMVVEEPSVVAAASAACKTAGKGGGFTAEADAPVMIAQVQFDEVSDAVRARASIEQHAGELSRMADEAMPGMVARGGGMRGIEVRDVGGGMLVVHLLVDCRDAMGANIVNTVAERVGPRIAELAGARLGLRILSNLADHRKVRVRCAIPASALAAADWPGEEVAAAVERASRFAEADPYRAATHNKGIMNGIDPVVIATGNDWRAVEAGAHAYAARTGRYQPLATWRVARRSDGVVLEGSLELPMALGIVGGTLGQHRAAKLALRVCGARSAAELGMLAASMGLASNLAALRALSTEGIQRGHMSLHARSVALAAGAIGEEVEQVAAELARARRVHRAEAERVLRRLRGGA